MKSYEGILGNFALRKDTPLLPPSANFHKALVQSLVCDSTGFSSWKENQILLYEHRSFQIKGAAAEMLITQKKP